LAALDDPEAERVRREREQAARDAKAALERKLKRIVRIIQASEAGKIVCGDEQRARRLLKRFSDGPCGLSASKRPDR
jgi:hypothetical protein